MPRASVRLGVVMVVVQAGLAACGGEEPARGGPGPGSAGMAGLAAGAGPASAPGPSVAGSLSVAAGSFAARTAPPAGVVPVGPTAPAAAAPPPAPGPGSVGGAGAGVPSAGAPAPASAGAAGSPGTAADGGRDAAGRRGSDAIIRGADPSADTGTKNGPFKVEKYTAGFADKPGFLAGTVYYPADAEPPFAYVVFCPGFVSYQTSIQDWGPFLASHGIVIMTIDTNSSSDSVSVRQTALSDALSSLQAEQERADSPLKGKLHPSRFGLMGWSMGGGASLLNATKRPELKSVVTVAEHLATAPGMSAPLKGLKVPVLMFAGTADTAVLGLNMSQPAYETIPETTTKLLYEVQDADHFFFNTPKSLDGVVGKYGLAWQKVFLEGDARYQKFLMEEGPKASDFRSNLK